MDERKQLRKALANLSNPFRPQDIEWRAGQFTRDGSKVMLLAYITSRAVMDRLDAVVGPENWCASYEASPITGGLECRLSIRMLNGEWVTKTDAAEPTQIESVKGAYSDALKRAAVHWGVGRYLYNLDSSWVAVMPKRSPGAVYVASKGNSGYALPPTLPNWALPVTEREDITPPNDAPADVPKPAPKAKSKRKAKAKPAPAPAPEAAATEHDSLWEKDRNWFCAAMEKFGGYDTVKTYTLSKGWGKPSIWGTERRRNFTMKLQKREIVIGE